MREKGEGDKEEAIPAPTPVLVLVLKIVKVIIEKEGIGHELYV